MMFNERIRQSRKESQLPLRKLAATPDIDTASYDEAKFLTDFGGHQNAQFADAISTVETPNVKAVKIAILDGVLISESYSKMYEVFSETHKDYIIMSVLMLRTFLYQL